MCVLVQFLDLVIRYDVNLIHSAVLQKLLDNLPGKPNS